MQRSDDLAVLPLPCVAPQKEEFRASVKSIVLGGGVAGGTAFVVLFSAILAIARAGGGRVPMLV